MLKVHNELSTNTKDSSGSEHTVCDVHFSCKYFFSSFALLQGIQWLSCLLDLKNTHKALFYNKISKSECMYTFLRLLLKTSFSRGRHI